MTTDQLAAQLAKVKQEINTEFPKWADKQLGLTAYAMIKERITRKGEAAEGNFKPYSTKSTLVGASSFRTKAQATTFFGERGPKNKKSKKLDWRTVNTPKGNRSLAILPGGYKKLRDLVGAESTHKEFLWSGEMWGSTHVQIDKKPNPEGAIKGLGTVKTGEGQYTTTVGSQNPLTIKKLEGHFKREGKEILMLSKKEETALLRILDEYITNKFKQAVNG